MAPRLLFGRGWRIQWSIVPEVSEVAVSPREARGSSTSARSGLGLGPLLVPRGLLQLCGRPPGALPRGGRGGEGPPPQPGAPGSCTPTPRQPTRPCLLCARLGCSGGGVPADPSQPGWDVLGGAARGPRRAGPVGARADPLRLPPGSANEVLSLRSRAHSFVHAGLRGAAAAEPRSCDRPRGPQTPSVCFPALCRRNVLTLLWRRALAPWSRRAGCGWEGGLSAAQGLVSFRAPTVCTEHTVRVLGTGARRTP